MSTLNEILVKNERYYVADEIVAMYPKEFKEAKKRPRNIIEYNRIPPDSYIYMSNLKSGWKMSQESNNKAKALIKKEWLELYFTKQQQKQEKETKLKETKETNEIKELPPLLELTDGEKFKDENGEIMEIETRGERKEDSVILKLKM